MRCASCSAEVPATAKFCPQCAAPRSGGSVEGQSADPLGAALQGAVGKQYEVTRLLGRGGMGAVFLAREQALDRDVAIKVLPPDRTGDAERERFRREARTAARLTHPNIVPLHAFGDVDGTMYFVMGCVRGEVLSARMKRGLTTEAARRILVELADALDHAHRQGVIHRDMKPENVLIDDDSGRAMLTDFGIAKAAGPVKGLTTTGAVVGTPNYMSPEQAAGKTDLDGRSDIYALGVMGYAMLSGRLPFEGPSVGDVLVQHMTKEPPPLKSLAQGVPDGLAAVIMRCLAKAPEDRWPDARSLRDALASSGESGELPEELRQIDGVGLVLVAAMFGALAFHYVDWLWLPAVQRPWMDKLPQGVPGGIVLPTAAVAVLVFLLRALPVRREGFGWNSIGWAGFLEPAWWRWWYPRRLRRPEDQNIWERLPERIRWARLATLAVPIVGLLGIAILLAFASPRFSQFKAYPRLRGIMFWPPLVNGVRPIPAVGPIACLLGWAIVGVATDLIKQANHRWLRRFGLSEADRKTIVSGALPRPAFWRKPAVAAILRPEGEAAAPAPRTPPEMARGIATVAEALAGPEAAVAREAAAAARQLIASIEELDREIQSLARDADPKEKERLQARLAVLGDAAVDEPDERRKMRSLFEQQMQLLIELEARLAAASDRRGRRVELLKALWLEAANLRAAAAGNAPGRGQTTERVRALCARIAAAHEAPAPTVTRDASDDMPTLAR